MFARLLIGAAALWSAQAAAHDIVIERNTNLRSAPSSNSEIIILLEPRNEVRLIEIAKENGYLHVAHRTGIGWVWSRNVRIFPDYVRSEWKHWIDEDDDCQDTRQEVLIAESEVPVSFKGNKQCKVESGQWTDPYTGGMFTDPMDLDVDHMVPLKNVHRSGGWRWSFGKREAYANDLSHSEHLIAVKASANRSKGAKGPDQWKPSNEAYHCQYARDWEAVKSRWGLSMTAVEAAAVEEMKATCP